MSPGHWTQWSRGTVSSPGHLAFSVPPCAANTCRTSAGRRLGVSV